MFLGIEIGGTKLQLGLGRGDGELLALWRGSVDAAAASEGIRQQVAGAVPELLAKAGVERRQIRGIGVGFGGPTDDETQRVIKSHHVAGWDNFPLADWLTDVIGLPTVICNDADVAGLAEALHGAGRGLSPIFYITVGTGIGGGLVTGGGMYRGVGKGACEIGHLLVPDPDDPSRTEILETFAAGWGIEARAARLERSPAFADVRSRPLTVRVLADAARRGHPASQRLLTQAVGSLALAIRQLITLLCPRRIVIGGGVSLMGDDLFFDPLRRMVRDREFEAFAGYTDIVPASLGEEVVVHGAVALARQKLGG